MNNEFTSTFDKPEGGNSPPGGNKQAGVVLRDLL